MSTQSIPFVFLGDKATSLAAAKFYKSLATKITAEIYTENKAMEQEWAQVPGSLFHFETWWGPDGAAPVFMSATPFGGPVVGHITLAFSNTPAELKYFKDLFKKLSAGGKVYMEPSTKSWGEHAYCQDKFGVYWHLTVSAH